MIYWEEKNNVIAFELVLALRIFKESLTMTITYAFYSESTLHGYLNFKELLAQNRRDIRSLSDRNGFRTHSHFVGKLTFSFNVF